MKNKIETPKQTDYKCPVCKGHLFSQWGNQMFPDNKDYGVTLFCPNGDSNGQKHPQEVMGHGNGRSDDAMIKHAYSIIQAKFCGGKLEDTENVETNEEKPAGKPIKKRGRKPRQDPPVVEQEPDLPIEATADEDAI